jgi:hypothetical protein
MGASWAALARGWKGELARLNTPSRRSRERSERCPLQRGFDGAERREPAVGSTRTPFIGA